MAFKGLNILSLANPTDGPAYANVFAKITLAEVRQDSASGTINVQCQVQYFITAQAYTDNKPPVVVEDKFCRVSLVYSVAEWAALTQESAYIKLKAKMEDTVVNGGFGWTGVTTILA